jgi:hypothetical protein
MHVGHKARRSSVQILIPMSTLSRVTAGAVALFLSLSLLLSPDVKGDLDALDVMHSFEKFSNTQSHLVSPFHAEPQKRRPVINAGRLFCGCNASKIPGTEFGKAIS